MMTVAAVERGGADERTRLFNVARNEQCKIERKSVQFAGCG